MSADPYAAAWTNARQAAMARAAAQFQRRMNELRTASAQFSAAEQARREGNILLASRIYKHYASGRDDDIGVEARRQLGKLAEEARSKLSDLDAKLAKQEASYSPGELMGRDGLPPQWEDAVVQRAPEESEIHGAARKRVEEMSR